MLPDGVGLRNFVFTDFLDQGKKLNWDITVWNNTVFNLSETGVNDLPYPKASINPRTDLYKRVLNAMELKNNFQKTGKKSYLEYLFPKSYKGLKPFVKSSLVDAKIAYSKMFSDLDRVREKMYKAERKSALYDSCKIELQKQSPDLILSTNQRPVTAIAPILAAQDLGIPTGTFIFSWDNLPKATMVLKTDYYYVWSEYMKDELLFYYPFVKKENIFVVGTPQFAAHFNEDTSLTKEQFFKEHNLDLNKKYICFTGDDVTTSPNDATYLSDVAEAIVEINKKNTQQYGLIFRKCPADFSDRYDSVLEKNSDIIKSIDPLWTTKTGQWDQIMPTPEDAILLANTIRHTETAINLGSSIALDYACHDKVSCYLNYDVEKSLKAGWSTKKIYKFIHFESMKNENPVYWADSKAKVGETLLSAIEDRSNRLEDAKSWLNRVSRFNQKDSVEYFWAALNETVRKNKKCI